MSNFRANSIEWSLGDAPHWEKHDSDQEDGDDENSNVKSVADSLVILQSLRQSRDKWLNLTFPKFSSKSRGGKPAEVVPPPHAIHNRGRCDIEIGPHIFLNTVIFEVHYQYIPALPNPSPYVYQPPAASHTNSWQATTPYGAPSYVPYGYRPSETSSLAPLPIATSVETIVSQRTSAPLLSSLGADVAITPVLIAQVNVAAASNPTLANLLQLAASGQATPDQLKTLGLLIQSLAGMSGRDGSPESPTSASISGSETPQQDHMRKTTPAPAFNISKVPPLYPAFGSLKEFDIVLEFAENPSDRWIFPRSPAVLENIAENKIKDILLTVGIPFSKSSPSGSANPIVADHVSKQLATFRFVGASTDIGSCLSRWVGPQETMEATRKAFQHLLNTAPAKVYLAHQLPVGPLLTQIQNSAMPPYTMKSIRPSQGDPTKPKRVRKPAIRKATTGDVPILSLQPPLVVPIPVENVASPAPIQAQPNKQKKQGKVQLPLPKMACGSCGQTDVPLIRGGKFCRPCAGAELVIPGVPANNGTFMHKFWAGPPSEGQYMHHTFPASTAQSTTKRKTTADKSHVPTADSSSHPADSQASSSTVAKRKKAK